MTAREAQPPERRFAPVVECDATSAASVTLLFAYGTLGPTNLEAATRDGWVDDAVRGRLFDVGPYPALVELNGRDARWVEGFVRAVSERELLERLDPYEAVDQGLYERVVATTRKGRRVWVYIYARALPSDARELFKPWHQRDNNDISS